MKMDRDKTSRWIATLCGIALVTVSADVVQAQNSKADVAEPAATADPPAPPQLDPPIPPGREVEVPDLDVDGRDSTKDAPAPSAPSPSTDLQDAIPADIDVPTIQPAELEPSDSFDPNLERSIDDRPNDLSPGLSPRSRVEDTLRGYDADMIDDDANLEGRGDIIPRALSDEERTKLGVKQGRFKLPTLSAPTTTQPSGEENRTPPSFSDNQKLLTEPLPESGPERADDWNWSVCEWSAANTFSNPRYFEDRMLERHGHERWGHLQSVAAGARFFATFPMLPYLCTVSDPCECEYTLGYLRSGSCAPVMLQRPPCEKRAAIVESAIIAGLIVGFP